MDDSVGGGGFWTAGRVALVLFGLGLSGILLLEVWVRVTTPKPRWVDQRYVEISRDFEELDALLADWGHPVRYYDEFLYAPSPSVGAHINYSDYYSARLTPSSVPLSEADYVVWTFGGSTMRNEETTDSLTIANTWARAFNRSMGPAHVKNFGEGGFFSSYQLIKFQRLLREVPEGEQPDVAIFYDGYNDAVNGFQYGAGSLQKDLTLKLRALVEGRDLALWALATSNALERISFLWRRTGAQVVQWTFFPLGDPDPNPENLEATVRVYVSNVRMLRATCDAFGVRCFFLLQPLLLTKTPLAGPEQEAFDWLARHPRFGQEGIRFVREFYRRAARELAGEAGFVDASRILDGRDEADFYDVGHVGALTPPVIGERTAALLLPRLGVGGGEP